MDAMDKEPTPVAKKNLKNLRILGLANLDGEPPIEDDKRIVCVYFEGEEVRCGSCTHRGILETVGGGNGTGSDRMVRRKCHFCEDIYEDEPYDSATWISAAEM